MSYDFISELDFSIDSIKDEVYSGNEDFKKVGYEKPAMPTLSCQGNNPEAKNNPGTRLHIRTNDNIVFRIYFCANTMIDSPYFQNRFCLFLDSLNENQRVIIEMGSGINGSFPDMQLGMMISSIKNCKAEITTVAAGRCGFAESCLFIYGKKKIISPYGALFFNGIKSYTDRIPMYVPYFTQIFKDGLQAGIYDQTTYNTLTTTGKFVMINHKETIIP